MSATFQLVMGNERYAGVFLGIVGGFSIVPGNLHGGVAKAKFDKQYCLEYCLKNGRL